MPVGVVRVENKRHAVRYWTADWPEELGPTFVIVKKPSQRAAGRPRPKDQRDLVRLRIATAAYEARGKKFEAAIRDAMIDLDWPCSVAEIERIRSHLRRAHREEVEKYEDQAEHDPE